MHKLKSQHPSVINIIIAIIVNFYNSTKNPREETFSDMMVYTCLPAFKIRSLTFILIALNCLVYVVTLLYGGIDIGGPLLEPTQNVNFIFSYHRLYSPSECPMLTLLNTRKSIKGFFFLFFYLQILQISFLAKLD